MAPNTEENKEFSSEILERMLLKILSKFPTVRILNNLSTQKHLKYTVTHRDYKD